MRAISGLSVLLLSLAITACGGGGDDDGSAADATPGADAAGGADGGAADGGGVADAGAPDALPPTMSITGIVPEAASRNVDTDLTITGALLEDGASITLINCDDPGIVYVLPAGDATGDGHALTTVLGADATLEQGLYTVVVENPGGQTDEIACGFRILASDPPTITDVTPASAYAGVPGDGVLSDNLVVITGSGFESTPAIRWQSIDNPALSYLSPVVGFISSTSLTAIAPSESQAMVPGTYHVFAVNPDLLEGEWLLPDTSEGLFLVSTTAPPKIDAISPERVEQGVCTTTVITLSGSGFDPAATVAYVVPGDSPDYDGDGVLNAADNCPFVVNPLQEDADLNGVGDACEGVITACPEVDANGDLLCTMTVAADPPRTDSTLGVTFASCPGSGAWPIVVTNPDGQRGYYYSAQVTPSADGHLNQGAWSSEASSLVTARWKHGLTFGFDSFGHAFLYVSGGQRDSAAGCGGASDCVLDTTELAQLSIFGEPGPFAIAEQYQDEANPRVPNRTLSPRQGLTLLRVGRFLYALGGSAVPSDVVGNTTALATVERAAILGYEEIPGLRLPAATPDAAGLPDGTWYYQVSALGSWGEGLPTREMSVQRRGGDVSVCWGQVPGATGYNVYRSLASDGRSASAALLVANVAAPDQPTICFSDDGRERLAPGPGRVRGALAGAGSYGVGVVLYRVSALVPLSGGGSVESKASYPAAVSVTAADVAGGNRALRVSWDAVPAATGYLVYRWNGSAFALLAGGPVADTTLTDDGLAFEGSGQQPQREIRPLQPGALSRWTDQIAVGGGAVSMTVAREGLDGVSIRLPEETLGDGLPVARLLVGGGRSSNVNSAAYLKSAESAPVFADGTVGAFELEAPQFNFSRAFYALVTTLDRDTTPFPPPPVDPPCPDLDGDSYIDCTCAPAGMVCDCVDSDPSIHPNAMDQCGDNIDQDCDGMDPLCECTTDADHDGSISKNMCMGLDCCDAGNEASLGCSLATAGGIHPGATEICGNNIDEDCDGVDPACTCTTDADGDGHVSILCGGDDCCDTGSDTSLGCTNSTAGGINPGRDEVCGNGIDENCDGFDSICRRVAQLDLRGFTPPNAFAAPLETCVPGEYWTDVIAVYGASGFATRTATSAVQNGRNDLEACTVDRCGRLSCGASWALQQQTAPISSAALGEDAVLYFGFLFPFGASKAESDQVSALALTLSSAAVSRFALAGTLPPADPTLLFTGRQSSSTSFNLLRSHYQMTRLMSYVYTVGGYTAAGVTGTVERHLQ